MNRLHHRQFMLLLCAALFTACRPAGQPPTPKGAPPERVISLAPGFTETIYALGEQERLVGVTHYCVFPPEAAKKPQVGALMDVDYEKIRSLSPQLVLCVPAEAEVARRLDALGIPSIIQRSETISDIEANITRFAGVLGVEAKGREALADFRARMEALRQRTHFAKPPRILFVVGRNPGTLQQIYACGSGNFLHEILTTLGAENIMGSTSIPWPLVNKENILALDPDLILDSSSGQGETALDPASHMKAWEQLGSLSAVREGRVAAVHDDHLLIPGPGFIESAAALADLIAEKLPAAK